MKKTIIISILMLVTSSCSSRQFLEGMKKNNIVFYEGYVQQWLDEEVPPAVDKIAQTYISGKRTLIWRGDMNADGKDEYFIAEKFPDVHHAVTQAVILDERGRLYFSVNTRDGVKSFEKTILDFQRMGLRDGEVASVRLIFTEKNLLFSQKMHQHVLSGDGKNLSDERYLNYGSGCAVQLLDKDSACIGYSTYMVEGNRKYYKEPVQKTTLIYRDRVETFFQLYWGGAGSEERYYNFSRKWIENYRREKEAGIMHKVP